MTRLRIGSCGFNGRTGARKFRKAWTSFTLREPVVVRDGSTMVSEASTARAGSIS
jgi:hypothetical protein